MSSRIQSLRARSATTSVIWFILVLFTLVAAVVAPQFASPANLLNILLSAAFLGCLALAQSFVLVTGHFDLSTESSMILSAILASQLVAIPVSTMLADGTTSIVGFGLPWWIGVASIILIPMLIGFANGFMVVRLRGNPLMTTLGMLILLIGLAVVAGGSRQTTQLPDEFRWFGEGSIGPIPVAGLVLLVAVLVTHIVWRHLRFGLHLFAVGGNRGASRASGINDDRTIIAAYVATGLLVGIAALILTGRLGAVSAGVSTQALFLSVAAAVIGGVSLSGGRGTTAGVLGGVLLMSLIANALTLAQVDAAFTRVATGIVILVAVLLDGRLQRDGGR